MQNGLFLDGVSLVSYNWSTPGSINGVNLGVDAIEEFSVQTSTPGAQYGRFAGGVVNAATRSGMNQHHGSLFCFHRNDNLDARDFFDGARKPEFRRRQHGGSLEGRRRGTGRSSSPASRGCAKPEATPARPQPGFLGNLGRNTIRGPLPAGTDFSLARRFALPALGRDGALDLRLESFTLFNRASFDPPSPDRMEIFTAAARREDAGRITSAGHAREIRFGLRIQF